MVSNGRLAQTWPAETVNQSFGRQGSSTGSAVARATRVDTVLYTWYTFSPLPLMRIRIAGLVSIDPGTCGPSCAEVLRQVSVRPLGRTRPRTSRRSSIERTRGGSS